MAERFDVRADEVGHVDVVAQARAVRRRIIRAEHFHARPHAERGLDRDLDQVGSIRRRLAGATLRVRTADVEIAEHHVAQVGRLGRVLEHPLDHQLRPTVGVDRDRRDVFRHRVDRRVAVNGSRRGEHELLDAALDRAGEKRACHGRIVEVVPERVRDRVRHYDLRREVDDGLHAAPGDQLAHERLVAEVADHELDVFRQRPAEARGQVVEYHDRLAAIDEFPHHVAADVARAARHQNRHWLSPPKKPSLHVHRLARKCYLGVAALTLRAEECSTGVALTSTPKEPS